MHATTRPSKRVAQGRIAATHHLPRAILVALATLPVINIARILATTGADVPSSDDVVFVTQLIGPILEGTFEWRTYLRASFYNTHALALPGLAYIAAAKLTSLSIPILLALGLALAVGRIILLHAAFSRADDPPLARAALWPVLAALACSTSQISIYEHGFSSMAQNINQFGVALGIWGLSRFPGRWRGVWLMALGGLVASFSFGSGPLLWPALLLGMLLLGYRRAGHYLVWLLAALLSAWPYLDFLIINRIPNSANTHIQPLWRILSTPVVIIGLPLAQRFATPVALGAGLLGGLLCAVGLALLWRSRPSSALGRSAPALMLIAHSGLIAAQLGVFRNGWTAWYTYVGALFWTGLVGLAYTLWLRRWEVAPPPVRLGRHRLALAPLWVAAVLGVLATLYAASNLTYMDKSILLQTRSPAAAACVRHYRLAPTYCENPLVIWPPGDASYLAKLASPLERHRLSVFAPRQEWTLQGDFVLDTPLVDATPGGAAIRWSPDLTARAVPATDYRHLNLLLRPGSTLRWTVTLPPGTQSATFHTAIAVGAEPAQGRAEGDLLFEIAVGRQGVDEPTVFSRRLRADERRWQTVDLPLTAYAGQTITLRLVAHDGGGGGRSWAAYRFPSIALTVDARTSVIPAPSDTLSLPAPTADDLRFAVTDPARWRATGMRPVSADPAAGWVVGSDPHLEALQPLNACLADYTHLSVQLAASGEIFPRALQIAYQLNGEIAANQRRSGIVPPGNWLDGQTTFDKRRVVTVPLLADEGQYGYAYPLRLLALPDGARLTGLRLDPVYGAAATGANTVRIADFRLIRGGEPSACAP